MKLYVCYGTFAIPIRRHRCRSADQALRAAGHKPQVIRAYGYGGLGPFNATSGRREVKRISGNWWVPALELDDGTVISGSEEIVAWATANPA